MAFRLPKVFNCHAASEMTSRQLSGGKLGVYDRFALAFHLLICSGCRFVERQFTLIDAASRHVGMVKPSDNSAGRDNGKLSEETKEKLRKVIR